MSIRYVLRDLHGVAELEARLARIAAHPNPHHAPDNDGLDADLDRVCFRNFGLDPRQNVELNADERRPALEERGWDVTDGAGGELRSYARLATVIAIAQEGVAGHLPGQASDRDLTETEAASIAEKLQAAADSFKPSRGPRE